MNKPLIIGHRGSRCHFPENTLPAYRYAVDVNVDIVDVDVVVTKDKVLLAYHDLVINPDILSDSDGNYLAYGKKEFRSQLAANNEIDRFLIKNLTLAELQNSYRVKLNRNSPYAKFFPDQQDVPDTRLSSLQEIVDYVNGLRSKNFKVDPRIREDDIQIALKKKNVLLSNKMDPSFGLDDISSTGMSFQVEIKNDLEHPEYSYSNDELAKLLYDFIIKNNLLIY